ncbi:MAG: hypothetical protein JW874_04080 [Spirochaetales bacterium]|nr:hypothetical protein [Spirochaetales bacterium]
MSIIKFPDNIPGMWIIFSVLAALFQTFRNIFSKQLSLHVPGSIASLCRFLFGAPFALAAVLVLALSGNNVAIQFPGYLAMCAGMAVFQLLANILLIGLFRYRNLAISMTLIKTEAVILAFLGIFTLHEVPDVPGWIGILLATGGLVFAGAGKGSLRMSPGEMIRGLLTRTSLLALGAGASLAACSVFLKKSYQYISSGSALMKVMVTLAVIMCIQIAFSFILIKKRHLSQIRLIFKIPVPALLTGLFAVAGSFCWFTAFSMNLAAYVRAVGQVEFIFGLAASFLLFREKTGRTELAGMAGVAAGIMILVLT